MHSPGNLTNKCKNQLKRFTLLIIQHERFIEQRKELPKIHKMIMNIFHDKVDLVGLFE